MTRSLAIEPGLAERHGHRNRKAAPDGLPRAQNENELPLTQLFPPRFAQKQRQEGRERSAPVPNLALAHMSAAIAGRMGLNREANAP